MKAIKTLPLLGITKQSETLEINFFSKTAHSVSIALYYPKTDTPFQIIPLQKEGLDVWKQILPLLPPETEYLFQVDGIFVLDPYAKALSTSAVWGTPSPFIPKCQLTYDHTFLWDGIKPPRHPPEDLIIYEMHVRGFTQSKTSKVNHKGTFLGMIEKLPYLKNLGITAIELLPIHEFDENENPFIDPMTGKRLCNYWGYMSLNFFSPMKRYASNDGRLSSLSEFKTLVKECHRLGIEVILDVVYNHVSEKSGLSSIDKQSYFILGPHGEHTNYTGCGNTIHANSLASMNLILSSLRYFVEECHVDGFRFDLGGALVRGKDGSILTTPPLFKALEDDPLFSHTKLIIEPWDCGGAFLLDHFPLQDAYVWNGNYKTDVRKFIKGELHNITLFEEAFLGSKSLCKDKGAHHYVHYISCHDGFTVRDLVSYDHKHNEENGENNRDGDNYNFSYNHGVEGPTLDPKIKQNRLIEILNFHLLNLTSHGIPMLTMGDEIGATRFGNNNPYCQDTEINWLNWEGIEEEEGAIIFSFVEKVLSMRLSIPHLFQTKHLKEKEIVSLRKENDILILLLYNTILFGCNRKDQEIDLLPLVDGHFDLLVTTHLIPSSQSLILAPKSTLIACRR